MQLLQRNEGPHSFVGDGEKERPAAKLSSHGWITALEKVYSFPPLVLLPQPDSKSLTVVVGNVFKSPESFILLMMGCPCVTDIFSEGVKWWQLCLILKMKWSFEVYERRRESSLSIWLLWFLKSVCNPSKSFHKHFESFQEDLFYFVLVCLFGFLLGFPSLRGITERQHKGTL